MKNYRVRPFATAGRYPEVNLEFDEALIFRSGNFLFSCVENSMFTEFGNSVPEQPAHELENWTSNELRFFSSIYLGGGRYRKIAPYPLPIFVDIDLSEIGEIVTDSSKTSDLVEKINENTYVMRGNRGLVPTSSNQYETVEWGERETHQFKLVWDALKSNNLLILKGLYSLIKSDMLFQHFQFNNSALAETHISLDAAHCILREVLKEKGHSNPTSLDAGKLASELFGEEWRGNRFFEDFYEDRIRYFHADNRFGRESIPAFYADDWLFLQRDLKELYFILLTATHYEDE